MDETLSPQTPLEMFFILEAIAAEEIPAQTIAPKFTGRFNKGVDYVGDVAQFTTEFEADLAVIEYAIKTFGLPANLKLSVHSGSDKFSIYQPMRQAMQKFNAGIHLKTSGTTWLEELIGLALAGRKGLEIACQVYRASLARFDELVAPYATVVDIDRSKLPDPNDVDRFSGEQFANALRHVGACPEYNIHFRQFLHVSYKIAAEMGQPFFQALQDHADMISQQVTTNLYDRHIKPLFV